MVREQVIEFETVEKEVVVYVCDECGHVMDDDSELTTVAMAPGDVSSGRQVFYDALGDRTDHDAVVSRHLCESCSGLRSAIHIDRQANLIRERWDALTGKAAFVWAGLFFALGVAVAQLVPVVASVVSILPWWLWVLIVLVVMFLVAGDE